MIALVRGVILDSTWPKSMFQVTGSQSTTTGFAPAEFRTLMRLPWTNSQQRRFEWLLTCLRGADRVIPHGLWVFGYRLYLQTCGAENGSSRKVRTS